METVNCVLIARKDQEASNGIVHLIDAALDPSLFIPRDVAQVVVEVNFSMHSSKQIKKEPQKGQKF